MAGRRDSIRRTEHDLGARLDLLARIHRDADEWRVDRRLALLLIVAPVVGAIVLASLIPPQRLYFFLVTEDHILEWAQFVLWLIGAGFALLAARVLWWRRRLLPAVLYVALAVACVFTAGEEISWGQRVADLETPEWIVERNEQDEITLHNHPTMKSLLRVVYLVAGLYGSVVVWSLRWLAPDGWRDTLNLFVPPLFLSTCFLVLAGYRLVRFTVIRESSPVVSGFSEWPETLLAFGIAFFAMLVWRRQTCEWDDTVRAADALIRRSADPSAVP